VDVRNASELHILIDDALLILASLTYLKINPSQKTAIVMRRSSWRDYI